MTDNIDIFQPQPGFQTEFLTSKADIVIGGGKAGVGKSMALLLDVLRLAHRGGINAVIFRKQIEDLKEAGSIWNESKKIFTQLGLKANNSLRLYRLPKFGQLRFTGLSKEESMYSHQGAFYSFIGFDELTHFDEKEFWYLWARARDATGTVKPYLRATCNPDAGWVAQLIEWWIDENGYADTKKCGKLRWLIRYKDQNYWANSKETAEQFIKSKKWENVAPVSVTFIAGKSEDNQILLENDPGYFARLALLPESEKSKLLYGCWKVKKAGNLFKWKWFKRYLSNVPPAEGLIFITTDTASSLKTAADYTVFQVWQFHERLYLREQIRQKFTAYEQLEILRHLILQFKPTYVSLERASTGISLADELKKDGQVIVKEFVRIKDKYTRAYEIQAYVEQGYVYVPADKPFLTDFMNEVTAFSPENKQKVHVHDDQVDPFMDACYLAFVEKLGYSSSVNIKPQYIPKLFTKKSGEKHYGT